MPAQTPRIESSVRVRLVNPCDAPVQLVLEPWGEVYAIAPDESVDVEVRGPAGEALEIAHESEAIVVWGWPGSTARVFHGAEELGSKQGRPPVPGASAVGEAANAERVVTRSTGTRGPSSRERVRPASTVRKR